MKSSFPINIVVIIGLIWLLAAVRCVVPFSDAEVGTVALSVMWLVFSFIIPGAALFFIFTNRKEPMRVDYLTFTVTSVLLSVVWNCMVTLLLACAGLFSHIALWATHTALLAIAMWRVRPAISVRLNHPEKRLWWLIGILLIGGVLYCRPVAQIIGGRDPGVYVNTGVNIANSGRLIFQEPTVSSIPQKDYTDCFAYMYEADTTAPMYLPGYYITDFSDGTITPQFYHLYSTIFSLLYPMVGVRGMLYGTPFLALLALAVVFLLFHRHLHTTAACAATILLMIGVHQVWYTRYPNSEIFVQLCFFGSLLLVSLSSSRQQGIWWLAGAVLGASFFARIDSFLIVPALIAVLLFSVSKWDTHAATPGAFSLTALCLFLLSQGYGYFFTRPYYISRLGVFFKEYQLLLWGVFFGIVFILACIYIIRKRFDFLKIFLYLQYAIVVGMILFFAAGALKYHFNTIRWFTWYLSPLVLITGLAGMLLYAFPRKTPSDQDTVIRLVILITLAAYVIVYLPNPRIRPDHFWAIRRFTAVVLSMLTLFAGYAAAYYITQKRKMLRYAGSLLLCGQIVWMLIITVPTLQFDECEGIVTGLEKAGKYIPPDSTIFLFDATIGLYGTPMYFIDFFRHSRFFPIGNPKKFVHSIDRFENIMAPVVRSGTPVFFLSYRSLRLPFKTITAQPVMRIAVPISLVEKSVTHLPEKTKPVFGIPDNFLYIWRLR